MSSDKIPNRIWIEPLTGFFTEEEDGSPAYIREDLAIPATLTAENAKLKEEIEKDAVSESISSQVAFFRNQKLLNEMRRANEFKVANEGLRERLAKLREGMLDELTSAARLEERIGELRSENATLRKRVEELEAFAILVSELIDSSDGVYGLHLNGEGAPWSDLLEGGEFGDWLGRMPALTPKEPAE